MFWRTAWSTTRLFNKVGQVTTTEKGKTVIICEDEPSADVGERTPVLYVFTCQSKRCRQPLLAIDCMEEKIRMTEDAYIVRRVMDTIWHACRKTDKKIMNTENDQFGMAVDNWATCHHAWNWNNGMHWRVIRYSARLRPTPFVIYLIVGTLVFCLHSTGYTLLLQGQARPGPLQGQPNDEYTLYPVHCCLSCVSRVSYLSEDDSSQWPFVCIFFMVNYFCVLLTYILLHNVFHHPSLYQ